MLISPLKLQCFTICLCYIECRAQCYVKWIGFWNFWFLLLEVGCWRWQRGWSQGLPKIKASGAMHQVPRTSMCFHKSHFLELPYQHCTCKVFQTVWTVNLVHCDKLLPYGWFLPKKSARERTVRVPCCRGENSAPRKWKFSWYKQGIARGKMDFCAEHHQETLCWPGET